MSDLTTVNTTLKDQNKLLQTSIEGTATQQAKNAEAASEKRQYDEQVLSTLTLISESIKSIQPFKIDKPDSTSFLGSILKAFGLVTVGALGLAVGLAAGWVRFVGTLILDLGRIVLKLIQEIPRPKFIDDIIAAFKMDGFVGKKFKAALDLLTPKFIDDIIAAFKMEGSIGAKFKAAIDAITPKFITDIIAAFKTEGSIGTKFKNAVDAITPKFIDDIIKSFGADGKVGQLFTKIKNFFVGEKNIFKTIGTAVDTAIDSLKSFTGGIFNKIASPFKWLRTNTATGSLIGDMIDGVMGVFKGASGEGGFMTRVFAGIKSVFGSLKSIGSALMAPFTAIGDVFGTVTKAGTGGIMKTIMAFLNPFQTVFSTFARIGAKLAAPLNLIMGILDAGFETADAVKKSEGFFATLLNGIIGAIGGFIDGAVLQVADLLKDGVILVADWLGFGDAGWIQTLKALPSFSEKWNEWLDIAYAWVNDIFNVDIAALGRTLLGDTIYDFLFGGAEKQAAIAKEAEEAKQKIIDNKLKANSNATAAWEKRIGELENAPLKKSMIWGMSETQEDRNEEIKKYEDKLARLEKEKQELTVVIPATKAEEGGMVGMSPFAQGSLGKAMGLESGGLFTLSQGEMVLDNQAAQTFLKAAQLLSGSRAIEQSKGGGSPIVVNNNNVDNSQSNSSSQATTLRIPESVRSGEPTMSMALNSMSQ